MQVRGRVYCLAADAYFLMNPLRIYLLVTLCFFFPRDILPGRHGSFFVRFFSPSTFGLTAARLMPSK